jgi:hypothetical protein
MDNLRLRILQNALCQYHCSQIPYDCGLFVLYSLETFVKQAPEVFTMAELQCHEDSKVSALNRPSWIGCTPLHKCGLRGPWTYLYVLLQSTALEELVQSEATPRYEN